MNLKIKRIYDGYDVNDGFRILVDRLWPRGIKKENAHIDLWMKDIAPSNALRKWFAHDPEKFPEFTRRYAEELRANPAFDTLRQEISSHGEVTLLFSAKDEAHNNAVVLRHLLSEQ